MHISGRIDLVSQTLPSAGDWKEADLCPSTDPLRFVWAEEDGSYHEVHTTKDEVLDALEKNDQEESTKTTTSEYNEDNVTRWVLEIKSNAVLPKARHRWIISSKRDVLSGRNDAEMGPANSLHALA